MSQYSLGYEMEKLIAHEPINSLKPHPKNPNKHSPEQIDRLAKIIEYQGWRHPIVVSKQSGFIVAGHGRLLAAKKLGLSEVPVHYQDFANEDQEYAFVVSDNAIASWAELDLANINVELVGLGPDFDIDMLGISNFTIDISEKINSGDENSEWVGMPEFEDGGKYIKLIFHFNTELERELYVKENNIIVDHKHSNQWIVHK